MAKVFIILACFDARALISAKWLNFVASLVSWYVCWFLNWFFIRVFRRLDVEAGVVRWSKNTWADQFSFPSDGHVRSLLCWHLAHVFSSFTWHVALALCQYHSALYTLRSFSDVCCNFFVIDIFFSLFIHLDAPFDMCYDIFVAILFSPLACVVFFSHIYPIWSFFHFSASHAHYHTNLNTLHVFALERGIPVTIS